MAGTEEIQKVVGVGSLAFGAVAALAPRVFLGLYGVPDEPSVRTMTRLWGTRTAVLGALMFALDGTEDQQRVMTMTAGMNVADAVIVAASGGLPGQTRMLGPLTSLGFAGALAYALKQ